MKARPPIAVIGALTPVIRLGPDRRQRRVPLGLSWRRAPRRREQRRAAVIRPLNLYLAFAINLSLHGARGAGARPASWAAPRARALPGTAGPRRRRAGEAALAGGAVPGPRPPAGPASPGAAVAHGNRQGMPRSGRVPEPIAAPASPARRPRSMPAAELAAREPTPRRAISAAGRLWHRPPPAAAPDAVAWPASRRAPPGRGRAAAIGARPAEAAAFPASPRRFRRTVGTLRPAMPAPRGTALAPPTPGSRFTASRRRVELVWRSPGDGAGPAGRSLAAAPAAAATVFDRPPAAAAAAIPTATAPQVDRLVDEVIRRLDRVSRSERLRRGL